MSRQKQNHPTTNAKRKLERGRRKPCKLSLALEPLESRNLLSVAGLDWGHRVEAVEPSAASVLSTESPRELVIVDSAVPNYSELLADFAAQRAAGRNMETVLLDAQADGVAAVGNILHQYQGLDAVHVISHGRAGAVELGTSQLSTETLPEYATSIHDWSTALKPGADLLFYGCDVAAGAAGPSLLQQLKTLTGGDVAASTDATGGAAVGGDWNLEYQAGSIDTAVAPSAALQSQWENSLASQLQDGGLKIQVISAYNLVVDSNVESPSSYSPRSAYLGVKIQNTGATTLNDIYVKMGNLTNPATGAGTPGMYPTTTITPAQGYGYSGTFSLTHQGGASDATRYIRTLAPGESTVVYWLVSYPVLDAAGKTVTGATNSTADDLQLNYHVWGQAQDGATTRRVYDQRTLTCRNEISAAANKIWPNTTAKVPEEYLNAIQASLGWRPDETPRIPGAIATEGIWYDLGNIGAGFDNNGDLVPDRNAWIQPVGDPTLFDASVMRLAKTYGLVIVKLNDGTEKLIPFEDQLYFSQLPANNRGATGLVYYEFLPLTSGTVKLSPYQEVASGYNNEKFCGDYGADIGNYSTPSPVVAIDKVGPATVAIGSDASYTITVTNPGTVAYGYPEYGLPAVISDAIPANTRYVTGSASATVVPAGNSVQVHYSTDGGATWSLTEPPAAQVTNLQWWFSSPIQPGDTTTVAFRATALSGTIITNTGGIGEAGMTPVLYDTVNTFTTGIYSISGSVFRDNGTGGGIIGDGVRNGTESALGSIDVSLYLDTNANGVVDSSDVLRATTTSSGVDGTYSFANLVNGNYVVQVARTDPDRPTGYAVSTVDKYAVTMNGASQTGLVFGFSPTLDVAKSLVGSSPVSEGSNVSYTIKVTDLLKPSGWTGGQSQEQDLWMTSATGTFTNPSNAAGATTGNYATASANATLTGADPIDPSLASQTLPITHVEALIQLKTDVAFRSSDYLDITVTAAGTVLSPTIRLSGDDLAAYTSATQTGIMSVNITSLTTWDWAKLTAANTTLSLAFTRGNGNPKPTLDIDRFGFRVTTVAPVSEAGYVYWTGTATTAKTTSPTGGATEALISQLSAAPTAMAFDNVNNKWYLGYASGVIEQRNPDGTGVVTVVTGGGAINGLDIDAIHGSVYYWTTTSTVYRKSLSGGANTSIASGHQINGVAVDAWGGHVYWIDVSSRLILIYRANLDGTGAVNILSHDLGSSANSNAQDIELDLRDGKIYFTNASSGSGNGYVGIVNIDGTNPQQLISGLTTPTGLAVDVPNGKIYWGDSLGLRSANLDGTNVQTVLSNVTTIREVEVPQYSTSSAGAFDVNKTLSVVPLTDDYDQNYFQFVSASIAPDSVDAVNGLLTWNNVGSINAGASKTITVTLKSISRAGNAIATNVPNTATVTNPKLANGDPANDGTSTVNVDIAATAKIGDLVWDDKNGNGIFDGSDVPIPGVGVQLWNSAETTLLQSTTTDANGLYNFNAPAGTYVVKINTSTLPTGYSATFDADGVKSANKSTLTIGSASNPADNLGQDFGYSFSTAMVYGNVWRDFNADGSRAANDTGLGSVTVQLRNAAGTVVYTTTTDTNGTYYFRGVAAGSYYVNVVTTTLPAGYTWTQTADPDATLDSRSPSAGTFSVVAGDIRGAYDFGYTDWVFGGGPASIGDQVFYDWNQNNVQDAGDEGIPNVDVFLYQDANSNGVLDLGTDTLIRTTVTDANGIYGFSNLANGQYFVLVNERDPQFPANVSPSRTNPSGAIAYSGTPLNTIDFGYRPYGSGLIAGTVWNDQNSDQVQSGAAETGLANITVTLQVDLNGDGTYVNLATTTTNSTGQYTFGSLPLGNYRISVSPTDPNLPKSYNGQTFANTTPVQFNRTLSTGSPTAAANFGFAGRGAIGDFIFYDTNANGTQDLSETGIPGVTVELYLDTNGDDLPDGSPIATTVTADGTGANPAGFYQFQNVLPSLDGQFYVVKVVTSMYQTADPDRDGEPRSSTLPGLPPFDNMDSHIKVGYVPYTGADFGYLPSGVIGDRVWLDLNGDGVQDSGEIGIGGVTVTAVQGGTTRTTTTDSDGYYSFAALADGTWTVSISGSPLTGKTASFDADGTATPNTTTVHLSGGTVTDAFGSLGADFGLKLTSGAYTLSGSVVTNDQPVLGLADQSGSETPLAGKTVYLFTQAGDPLGATTTDAAGHYSFAYLPNGTYQVVLDAGDRAAEWATLNTTTGQTPATTIVDNTVSVRQSGITVVGANVTGLDYAFSPSGPVDYGDLPSSYGATTLNQDGARHLIPTGGATIYLGSVKPDAEPDGRPSLNANGDDRSGVPNDEDGVVPVNIASWHDGVAGGSVQVTVNVPAGKTAYLVGWIDFNHNNSLVDTVNGVSENVVYQTITGTGSPQVLTIAFDIPTGAISATSQSWFARFRLLANEPPLALAAYKGQATDGEVEDYLFQRNVGAAIGDRVWADNNDNGVQDANESGLGGVTVTLKNAGGAIIATMTTSNGSQDVDNDGVVDPVGYYRFTGLAAGNYTVIVSPLSGTAVSYDEDGPVGSLDGSVAVTLAANAQHLTADFGLTPAGSVTGHLFIDVNGSGSQDFGEPNLPNVDVVITDAFGGTRTVASDANGNYTANGVPVGTASVDVNNADPDFPATAVQTAGTDPSSVLVTAGATADAGVDGYRIPPTFPFILVLDDPNTPGVDVIVVDNMPVGTMTPRGPSNYADASATLGEIYYSGAAGSFSMNRVTARSKPLIGFADEADITINAVDRSSKAGTLIIEATDGNFFMSTTGTHQLTSPVGGVAAGTLTFSETVDLSNNPFAEGSNVNGYSNQLGTYQKSGFSGQKTVTFSLDNNARPLSLSKRITMVHTAALQQTSVNAGGMVSVETGGAETSLISLPVARMPKSDLAVQMLGMANSDGSASMWRSANLAKESHRDALFASLGNSDNEKDGVRTVGGGGESEKTSEGLADGQFFDFFAESTYPFRIKSDFEPMGNIQTPLNRGVLDFVLSDVGEGWPDIDGE